MSGNRILEALGVQAEMEGFEPGSQEYEDRLLLLRVQKCMEMQNIESCGSCPRYDYCELVKSALRLRVLGVR